MLTQKPVTEGLILLDIKPESFSEVFARYRDNSGLMHIKGCRRDVLIGTSEDLQNAPNLDAEGVMLYQNSKAYAHLLTYVTGLISRSRGECQIVSQFKGAYSELESRAPEKASQLCGVFQGIVYDNSLVRRYITPLLKPAFYEACAHELSEQNDEDIILIVANTHPKTGKPDAETENLVKYLGGNRRHAAKTIVFTHPDSNHLRNIYSYFLSQKAKGKYTSSFETLAFEQAFDSTADLQRFSKTFVCFPMGNSTEIDTKIIQEWRQREALGGRLIHLGGSKKSERSSRGAWSNIELWSYVSPEDIIEWQKTRKANNDILVTNGTRACATCAELRSENKRPNPAAILSALKAA